MPPRAGRRPRLRPDAGPSHRETNRHPSPGEDHLREPTSSLGAQTRGRPSFVPSTQYHAGTARLSMSTGSGSGEEDIVEEREDEDESEDELAFSPLRPSPQSAHARSRRLKTPRTTSAPPARSAHADSVIPKTTPERNTRSTPRTRAAPSSTSTATGSRTRGQGTRKGKEKETDTGRKTRAAIRRDREMEEMGDGDLVPPSEDGEYEDWRETRIRSRNRGGKGGSGSGSGSGDGSEADGERLWMVDVRTWPKRPRKPDKMSSWTEIATRKHNTTHDSKPFNTLFSSPPPIGPLSPTPSSLSLADNNGSEIDKGTDTEAGTRDTSPTLPLSFSQDDPFFPLDMDHNLQNVMNEEKNERNNGDSPAFTVSVEADPKLQAVDIVGDGVMSPSSPAKIGISDEAQTSSEAGLVLSPQPPDEPKNQAVSRSTTPQTIPIAVDQDYPQTIPEETVALVVTNANDLKDAVGGKQDNPSPSPRSASLSFSVSSDVQVLSTMSRSPTPQTVPIQANFEYLQTGIFETAPLDDSTIARYGQTGPETSVLETTQTLSTQIDRVGVSMNDYDFQADFMPDLQGADENASEMHQDETMSQQRRQSTPPASHTHRLHPAPGQSYPPPASPGQLPSAHSSARSTDNIRSATPRKETTSRDATPSRLQPSSGATVLVAETEDQSARVPAVSPPGDMPFSPILEYGQSLPQPMNLSASPVQTRDNNATNHTNGGHPPSSRPSSPAAPLSPMFAAVAEVHPIPSPPQSRHYPTPPMADPALEQFRIARTFRTRTVLQLQPYTKERQIYEAQLRKGGLKKGKKAIAPSKEVTQEDDEEEAQVDESSEASAEESSQRIVIGNTPPPGTNAIPKIVRQHKKLIDADFDEFFFEHGMAADETDPEVVEALQFIARRRHRAAKEEKRRKREAEREGRQFESLMRAMQSEREGPDDEPQAIVDRPQIVKRKQPVKPRSSTVRTPGPKTYGNKNKTRGIQAPNSSDSDNLTPPPPVRAISLISPSKSTGTPTASFRTAISGTADFDIGYGQPQEPFFLDTSNDLPQSPSLRHNESFLIDDLARSPVPRRKSASSHTSSDSESSSTSVLDPRKRIAGRMMPAAMLRRLEEEAAAKERRKQERKRREQRLMISPNRPGRAIVKRGGGQGGLNDFDSLFSDDDQDQDDQDRTPIASSLRPTNSFDRPIVISDGADSSSEAEEDNQAEQTLARLHRGDFEGIVAGNRSRPAEPKSGVPKRHTRPDARSNRSRRPALGLAKRVRAPLSEGIRTMVQSRLGFPLADHSPVSPIQSKNKSKKRKRPHGPGTGQKQRPAIRLDDHVIFATADFEFDSSDDVPIRPAIKRKQRAVPRISTSTPPPRAPQADPLDAGIGKARSWANFDKFPIDFDITPLPSGIYCEPRSIPGSGRLFSLIKFLRGTPYDGLVDTCIEYGIELLYDMIPGAIQAVVPLLFDAINRQMTLFANDADQDAPSLEPLVFLGRYMSARLKDIDEAVGSLGEGIVDAIRSCTIKLEELDIDQSRRGRRAQSALLDLHWHLFELALRIYSARSEPNTLTVVNGCGLALFRQLLSYGFDRTVRPLKNIMRGESDSPEIADQSVTLWISLIHTMITMDESNNRPPGETFLSTLTQALDTVFRLDQTGPLAAERIWFLVFGLCALSQFDVDGKISSIFITTPRWQLVRRAVGLIKVAFDEDAEKRAHLDQLQGRDRYVKVMMARCVRLSAIWKWSFDRESFSVATRDLGVIFKDRQYRNLPTEPPVDYPDFITRFDMSLTAEEDTKRETAFELYLRLVSVAASDIISAAQSLTEAQQAEKDVQRLVMSIIPVSAIKFNRLFPPSPKELGQLINRYSTMIAACYFSPSLLGYLLANSKKWSPFENADFDSRQICIRGLMYLTIARRHHNLPLGPVVNRLAELMGVLQSEIEVLGGPSAPTLAPNRLEIERTMVLVVTCFRQMIKHHSFDPAEQAKAVYPDPCLLHESWTVRIFDLELTKDLKCGLEVVATIQAFLDIRASALPRLARQRREAKESHSESFDEFGSLGIDFTAADVLALGGEVADGDPSAELDMEFAGVIETVISPKIYRLLSDMLPPVSSEDRSENRHDVERQVFISKLTKCWSDCAAVLVVEHQKLDWSTFISPFGRQSWARLGDERGRVQVGLHFMLNVAQLDPASFVHHEEDFIALLFQVIGTDKLTVEHKYLSALLSMQGALEHPLLAPLSGLEAVERELDRSRFMDSRCDVLRAIFAAIPDLLRNSRTPASIKSFIYRCINLFVSSIIAYDNSINPDKVIHKESYRAFTYTIIRDLRRLAGEGEGGFINSISVPGLKHFKD